MLPVGDEVVLNKVGLTNELVIKELFDVENEGLVFGNAVFYVLVHLGDLGLYSPQGIYVLLNSHFLMICHVFGGDIPTLILHSQSFIQRSLRLRNQIQATSSLTLELFEIKADFLSVVHRI